MPRALACVLCVSIALAGQSEKRQSNVSLREVLARAGAYVVTYGESLSTVLAEEQYIQHLTSRRDRQPLLTRRLQSEIAFVRLADTREWAAFRNVTSVDGRPVEDAAGKLERLFRDAPSTLLAQTRLIAAESARYNLGPITREINIPTLALRFLHTDRQSDCEFDKEGEAIVDGTSTWVVRFHDRRGGFIRRQDHHRLPTEGRVWIVPTDGRVLKTQLIVRDFVSGGRDSRAEITVTWRWDRPLHLWVPSEMRERYEGPWEPQTTPAGRKTYDIDGVAQYTNYRRFTVDVLIR